MESERITKRPPAGVFGPTAGDDPEAYDRDTIPAPSSRREPATLPGADASLVAQLADDPQDDIDTLRPPAFIGSEAQELGWQCEAAPNEESSPWSDAPRHLTVRPPPPAGFESVARLTPVPEPSAPVAVSPSLAPSVREARLEGPRRSLRPWLAGAAALLLFGAGVYALSGRERTAAPAPLTASQLASGRPAAPAAIAAPITTEIAAAPALPAVAPNEDPPPRHLPNRQRPHALAPKALTDEPDRQQIVTALNALRSTFTQCAAGKPGIAELDLTVASSGSVTHVLVGGDYHGAQGSCIARAARQAKVTPFKKARVRVLYRLAL